MICSTATSPYNKDLKIHNFREQVGLNYPSRVAVDTGRFPLTQEKLGNNGRLFYNYMVKIFAFPYP